MYECDSSTRAGPVASRRTCFRHDGHRERGRRSIHPDGLIGSIKLDLEWWHDGARVPIFVVSGRTKLETKMKFALIGAAAVVAAASVTPALAQAVISDPGYCAQFYPNANCQNLGPGNPYTDGGYFRNDHQNGHVSVEHHRQHHYDARHH